MRSSYLQKAAADARTPRVGQLTAAQISTILDGNENFMQEQWRVIAKMPSFDEVTGAPIHGTPLSIDHRKALQLAERLHLPALPLSPWMIADITPTSDSARSIGAATLATALNWAAIQGESHNLEELKRSSTCPEPLQQFTADYLKHWSRIAKYSPELCAVCTGLDLETACLLGHPAVDGLAAEIVSKAFAVTWRLTGTPSDRISLKLATQNLAKAFMMSPKSRAGINCRLKLVQHLHRVDAYADFELWPSDHEVFTSADCQLLVDLLSALGTEMAGIRRFLELAGLDDASAYNCSRSAAKALTPNPGTKAADSRRFPGAELGKTIKNLSFALTCRSLPPTATRLQVLTLFALASIVAVRCCGIDEREFGSGYWLARLIRLEQGRLEKLCRQ